MIEFGRRYDPQPFHTDPEAAAQTPAGGLIASGWFTAALVMRLMADAFLRDSASFGSPGVERLRFPCPVRPGDTITGRATVITARPSESKPDRGLITLRTEAYNQDGALVLAMEGLTILRRRPPLQYTG
jgi:acyl dehydratase